MFESDDFDQVLSQFEFPEDTVVKEIENTHDPESLNLNLNKSVQIPHKSSVQTLCNGMVSKPLDRMKNNENMNNFNSIQTKENKNVKEAASPKHTKRKMIHSYFDHQSKRKFPGPAGLLTGGFEENNDQNIYQMELLSQDVDFSQNGLRGELFESPLWKRLIEDLKIWNLHDVDSIRTIKQQALTGSLKRRKAHTITAFVETVDRSATDPLIIMRDTTGNIKGTLHRDAWSTFSKYIASEYCAFILWKPTILITGGAFKKHYLNITLSNILAIYSSTVLVDDPDSKPLPDGYSIVYEDDYTVIKTENCIVNNIGTNNSITDVFDNNTGDLLDGLDNIFSDEIF